MYKYEQDKMMNISHTHEKLFSLIGYLHPCAIFICTLVEGKMRLKKLIKSWTLADIDEGRAITRHINV